MELNGRLLHQASKPRQRPLHEGSAAELLGSLKIGTKTKVKRVDTDDRYRPLKAAVPDLVSNVRGDKSASRDSLSERAKELLITTETAFTDLSIENRLGLVTAEAAIGVNVLRDMIASVRDLVGGRSKSLQKELEKAREEVTGELKRQAYSQGADAIIGASLHYDEISGGGKTMLLLVAVGTAVTLSSDESP
jgi:uncharacterized protein YbjQ (UPF0145 family)